MHPRSSLRRRAMSGNMRRLGMFDWYEPDPVIVCPSCGAEASGWQGTEGPSALLVWHQGDAHPVSQRVDEPLDQDRLLDFALPSRFSVSTECPRGHALSAEGVCIDGAWTSTSLTT